MKLIYFLITSIIILIIELTTVNAEDTGRIFVSNEKSHEVIVFNKDFDIIKKIPTSRRPRDMEFNKERTLLFVACGDDDIIDIIDLGKLEVVDGIPTGPSPEEFSFSIDYKKIYVSNEEDSMLEIIDLETRITEHDVPTGAEPEGVIASSDGKKIYVTSEVADMVHVVNLDTGLVEENIVVGTRPRRFLFNPDETELWVSAELSSEIYIIDTMSNQVTDVLEFLPPGFRPEDVTPVGMAMTKDGKTAILSLGRANHIAIINAKTKKTIDYILVGERAWSVALNRSETMAVVANGLSDDITLVDLIKRKAIKSIPVGRVPHTVRIDD